MSYQVWLSFIVLIFLACNEKVSESLLLGEPIEVTVPCKEAMAPNLFSSEGDSYLTWIETLADTSYAFLFSKLENEKWSKPQQISAGDDWFVNWADFPSLVAYSDDDSKLAAHWLQMSADGTYDYDVHISQSSDAGRTWTDPFIVHNDGVKAEHGFVSMMPIGSDKIFATWLDGRNTKQNENTEDVDGHGHAGAMTLRAASFDINGELYDKVELDDRVCDCCQTSVAILENGIIVAYRNRSENEIRDIYVARKIGDQWLLPQTVHQDNWKINGCPVNGPVVRASGKHVAVAWFAMNDTFPEVKIAFSIDSGKTFDKPVRLDYGNPLGRVAMEFINQDQVLISWIEVDKEDSKILAIPVHVNGDKGEALLVNQTQSSRASGFPRMTVNDDRVVFAWTDATAQNKVRTKIFKQE